MPNAAAQADSTGAFPMPSPRAILFRLHWLLGLTAGLILAVMGATGALLSYEEALTDWANHDRLTVATRQTPPLPLADLAKRIEEQRPGQRVSRLNLRDDPSASVAIRFARDPRTHARPDSVFADPYDGAVLGPVRGEALFDTALALHRFLLLPGDGKGWGRQITGLCAIALLVFLVTGIVLRWPQVHRWRIWLRPSLSRPGRARWWSLHAVAGTWLLPVYAVIALSGLTWSYEWAKDGAPSPLKMPFQDILVGDLLGAIDEHDIKALVHYPAGQSIAYVNERSTVKDVMGRLVRESEDALAALGRRLQP